MIWRSVILRCKLHWSTNSCSKTLCVIAGRSSSIHGRNARTSIAICGEVFTSWPCLLLLRLIMIPNECKTFAECPMLIGNWYNCQGIKAAQRLAVVVAVIDRMMHVRVQQGFNSTTRAMYTVTDTCLKWQQSTTWRMITCDHENYPYIVDHMSVETQISAKTKAYNSRTLYHFHQIPSTIPAKI